METSIPKDWKGCKRPEFKVIEGRFVRLEPFDVDLHLDELHEASTGPDAAERFRYIWEDVMTKEELKEWMIRGHKPADSLYFAMRDKASGKVGGRQAFHSIAEEYGGAEIGNVFYGPLISRRPAATEAVYLFAKHLFDELGYKRVVWRCNNLNAASRRAALRFGFKEEGIFRQDVFIKGTLRDTAWFSIIDKEWPRLREAFENWLSPANFDEQGVQRRRLEEFRR